MESKQVRKLTRADCLSTSKRGADETITHTTAYGEARYTPTYSDDKFEYRHIECDRNLFKHIESYLREKNKKMAKVGHTNVSRLLSVAELRERVKLPMSDNWIHYHTHPRCRALLFKRKKKVNSNYM